MLRMVLGGLPRFRVQGLASDLLRAAGSHRWDA